MLRKVKIVLIGAGSASFARGIVADLIFSKDLENLDLTVTLVDIDEIALDRMFRFAKLLKKYHNSKIKIEAATDRKEALLGANYVITAVARKRLELWEQDFSIPLTFGFQQIYGENGGPGAAFHTLRSLHLMIPIAKDMEKLCPEAFLINFSNPESRVCLGVNKLTQIRAAGLCHGAFSTQKITAQILNKGQKDFEITIGGINHFHWVLNIKEITTGKDLYPEFHKKMESAEEKIGPLTYLMYKKFGLFPFPDDTHIGEYVPFAYEICGPKWYSLSRKRKIFAKEEKERYGIILGSEQEIQQVVAGKKPLSKELMKPSGELTVSIIGDIEFNRNKRELSVNIPNEGMAIPNLPEDAIVEIPARVDKDGVHPIKVGPLPEAIAGLCHRQITIQNLLVQAYKERSKKILLQALIIDPIVNSISRAEQMMEQMLEMQADFLPKFR